MTDDDLRTRLQAMESRAPAPVALPNLPIPPIRSRGWRRLLTPVALAPALLVVIVATAAAGGAAVADLAVGRAGAENPGQPLQGANLECMKPPAAAAYLAAHGYTKVVWQVETGSAASKSGQSVQQPDAPERGYVVPGAFLGDGTLIIVIDQREGASGVGACFGMPQP